MVFITGDCHGNFRRFGRRYFPEQETMDRDDYIIVAGDFGGVWADTPEEKLLAGLAGAAALHNLVRGWKS